jgi:hypothetical protein
MSLGEGTGAHRALRRSITEGGVLFAREMSPTSASGTKLKRWLLLAKVCYSGGS